MLIVNGSDIDSLIKCDSIFKSIYNTYGPPPEWSRPQGFETLCRIILEQQVSLESANAHFQKLKLKVDSFVPEEILKLSDEEMRASQISKQKASYLKNLSESVMNNNIQFDQFSFLTEREVRDKLTAIKGIGKWTSDIYLMFCLKEKDILPLGDIAVINTIKELKQLESTDLIYEISKSWSPYRTLATYFLWHYYLNKRGRVIP